MPRHELHSGNTKAENTTPFVNYDKTNATEPETLFCFVEASAEGIYLVIFQSQQPNNKIGVDFDIDFVVDDESVPFVSYNFFVSSHIYSTLAVFHLPRWFRKTQPTTLLPVAAVVLCLSSLGTSPSFDGHRPFGKLRIIRPHVVIFFIANTHTHQHRSSRLITTINFLTLVDFVF